MRLGHAPIVGTLVVALLAHKAAASVGPQTHAWQQFLNLSPHEASVIAASDYSEALPDYILIQDVHRHPEAQRHIASLLKYGWKHWGIQSAYIEGAFSGLDPDLPKQRRQSEAESELSGAEQALTEIPATGQHPFQLIGMESPDLYRENVAAYAEVTARRPQAIACLETMPDRDRELLTAILFLNATPAIYQRYQDRKTELEIPAGARDALRQAELFYALANWRSQIFLDNVEGSSEPGPRVLIVGGFHTQAMAQALANRHLSYVVLRPTLTQPLNPKLYEAKMKQTMAALHIPTRPAPAGTLSRP